MTDQQLGWGLLSQFPPFRYFPNFSASPKYMLAIVNLYITFKFDWCCRSSAAVTPVKYECDANNLTGTLTASKILLTEKLTNGALVTPTPDLNEIRPQTYLSTILIRWNFHNMMIFILENLKSIPMFALSLVAYIYLAFKKNQSKIELRNEINFGVIVHTFNDQTHPLIPKPHGNRCSQEVC